MGIVLWAASGGMGAQSGSVRVPELHGTVLSGERVDLPGALEGKAGVLVVGFSQASRGEVTGWGKRLAGDYRDSTTVRYYELAMLTGVPRLLRGWVLKRVAAEVPERAKARFVPIYDHEGGWKSAAGYGRADDAYVLVVDSQGIVRWKYEGAAGDVQYGELKRQVEELQGR